MKPGAFSPIIGMVKPLAKQYVNKENMQTIFDQIAGKYTPEEGEKVVLMITKKQDGTVCGSVAAMNNDTRQITGVYEQMELGELIMEMLGKL